MVVSPNIVKVKVVSPNIDSAGGRQMSSEVIACNATQSLHSAYDLTLDDQSKER